MKQSKNSWAFRHMSKRNPSSYYIPSPRGKSGCGEGREENVLFSFKIIGPKNQDWRDLAYTEMNNVTCTEFDVNVKNMIYYIGYIHGGCWSGQLKLPTFEVISQIIILRLPNSDFKKC